MRIFMAVIIFLLLGAFFVVSNEGLHLSKQEEFSQFKQSYTAWINGIFSNMQSISGNVVRLDWLPSSVDSSNSS